MNPTDASIEKRVSSFIEGNGGDFASLILEIHDFQKKACAPYAAFCATQPTASTWREIPAIPLSAFRQTEIRCFPAENDVATFHTSGTTGEGYGRHFFPTLELYRAAALGGWRDAGLPQKNVLCLLPSPEEASHSSLSCMGGWLASPENFYLGQWEKLRKALKENRPVTLLSTALAFLDFFEWLEEKITLPVGSVAVETGGYKGTQRHLSKPELYRLFEKKLGLPSDAIWNEYGMTELSSQFYTRGLGQPHEGAPWVQALVINPESGTEAAESETGVLRIFDLANLYSCCAIQTRDLAIRRGNHFELIGRDPAAIPRGCSRAADEMLSP